MKLLTSTALALLVVQNTPPLPQQSQVPMASIEGIVLRADNGDAKVCNLFNEGGC
jgi:hypothetical protein